uniref:Alanine transaminase n=1 Tax=Rhizophora mucronata TaxID=61149 RepID=A0A2P2KLH7_RHIMU
MLSVARLSASLSGYNKNWRSSQDLIPLMRYYTATLVILSLLVNNQ